MDELLPEELSLNTLKEPSALIVRLEPVRLTFLSAALSPLFLLKTAIFRIQIFISVSCSAQFVSSKQEE